jgi:hypothetical protein
MCICPHCGKDTEKPPKKITQEQRDQVEKGFEHFWKVWKSCKKALEVKDTSPKGHTFQKKWKPMFNASFWDKNTMEDYRKLVNKICDYCKQGHRIEGFNNFTHMQTGKFFTNKGWE